MSSVVHVDVAHNFEIVVDRIRKMADTTVDAGAIVGGLLLPGSISDRVAKAYDSTLFHGARLNVLPNDSQAGNPPLRHQRDQHGWPSDIFGRRCTRELI